MDGYHFLTSRKDKMRKSTPNMICPVSTTALLLSDRSTLLKSDLPGIAMPAAKQRPPKPRVAATAHSNTVLYRPSCLDSRHYHRSLCVAVVAARREWTPGRPCPPPNKPAPPMHAAALRTVRLALLRLLWRMRAESPRSAGRERMSNTTAGGGGLDRR